jgi:predicted transcriptional regulator
MRLPGHFGGRVADGFSGAKIIAEPSRWRKCRLIAMKISEIKEILKAEVLAGEDCLDDVVVGGGGADLMEDVLAAVAKGAVLLTGLNSDQVIRTAKIAGVGAVVFVRGKKPDDSLIALAREFHLPLLVTRHTLFVSCGRLYMNGLRGLDGSW